MKLFYFKIGFYLGFLFCFEQSIAQEILLNSSGFNGSESIVNVSNRFSTEATKKTDNSYWQFNMLNNRSSFNLFSVNDIDSTFQLGFHALIEDALPNEAYGIKDVFTYTLTMFYEVHNFQIGFVFENFMNIKDSSFELEPIRHEQFIEYYTMEFASAYFVSLNLIYTF